MLNRIFIALVLFSTLLAAANGRMDELTKAILDDSRKAVTLALGLVGVMAFFIGLMRVAEVGGMMRIISRAAAPVMSRLFPSVPPDHPAMSAMLMNIASNMMGLANAATPFGIKAMEELDKLNGRKGTATNAMVLFLAINTAGLAVLPSGVIGIRAALNSQDAAAIFFPTWFASGSATVVGILAAFLLSRLRGYRESEPPTLGPQLAATLEADSTEAAADQASTPESLPDPPPAVLWRKIAVLLFFGVFGWMLVRHVLRAAGDVPLNDLARDVMSFWILPAIVSALILFGWARQVRVYEALVEGAKEGFQVALRIIPFLVAILVAVGMFRASGGMGSIVALLGPLTEKIGMPAEALPLAILRPLTGSGALALMSEIMTIHGPDSFIGYMVSTINGSTETTFYVLAVYFGAVGVTRTRHALPACLMADAAGVLAAVFIVNLFFG